MNVTMGLFLHEKWASESNSGHPITYSADLLCAWNQNISNSLMLLLSSALEGSLIQDYFTSTWSSTQAPDTVLNELWRSRKFIFFLGKTIKTLFITAK